MRTLLETGRAVFKDDAPSKRGMRPHDCFKRCGKLLCIDCIGQLIEGGQLIVTGVCVKSLAGEEDAQLGLRKGESTHILFFLSEIQI